MGIREPGDLIGAVEALLEDRQHANEPENNTCVVAIDHLDIVLAAVRPLVKVDLHARQSDLARRHAALMKSFDEMLGTAGKVQAQADRIAENVAHVEKVSANGLDSMPPEFVRCESINPSGPEHRCALDENHDGEHLDGTLKWMVSRQTIEEAEAMHATPGPAYCGTPSPYNDGLICRRPRDAHGPAHQDAQGRIW